MPSIQICVAEVVEDWLPHLFHAFIHLIFTVIPFPNLVYSSTASCVPEQNLHLFLHNLGYHCNTTFATYFKLS